MEIIESFSIGACVYTILQFRNRFKNLMKVRRGLAKLLCFKGIVFIRFVQTWIFSLLLEYHTIKVSSTFSYNDILYGIPAVLTCVEMVLFSAAFWYAFSSTEYGSGVHKETPLPMWKAALHALNPWDLIHGMWRIFPLSIEMSRSGEWAKWRAVAKQRGLQGAFRKGVQKYKNKKGQGRYEEVNDERESLSRPMEMGGRDSYQDPGYYPMSGGMGGADIYQPPEGSPPSTADSRLMPGTQPGQYPKGPPPSYLGTDTAYQGRPRASSQSSLMAETREEQGRPRSPSAGQSRYDRSPLPSPGEGFVGVPVERKDYV